VIKKGVTLTTTPWSAPNATAIAQNATFWVWDPANPDYGIWGLTATDNYSVKDAIDKQSPVVVGWYMKIADKLPTLKQMKASGLIWQSGFFDSYLAAHPNEKPKPKPAEVVTQTFEVVGMMNGSPVPLTDVISYLGGSSYQLAAGASIAVGDSEGDGFNLAGSPGQWSALYPNQLPSDFGLDRDKGVLFWDGSKGQVLPASILMAWFGPGWRGSIYQQSQSS
jgi:hypothetical protein